MQPQLNSIREQDFTVRGRAEARHAAQLRASMVARRMQSLGGPLHLGSGIDGQY